MATLNPRVLKAQAGERLGASPTDPRRLVLIHTGIIVLLDLITSGLSIFLEYQIGGTGGLGGLGTRTILQTMQTLLYYGALLFTPFWQAGFTLVAIHWATSQPAGSRELTSGFRRFGSVLSYYALWAVLLFLVSQVCLYIASFIFTLTPWAAPLLEMLESWLAANAGMEAMTTEALMESLPVEAMMNAYLPMLAIWAVILIPVVIFLNYCLRLAPYFIMDTPRVGGVQAMLSSFRAMKGSKWKMLKLDFSFWWYYLIEFLLAMLCYLDYWLPGLGVELPFHPTVVYFATLVIYCALRLGFHVWKKAEVDTTYALAYREIITPPLPKEENT